MKAKLILGPAHSGKTYLMNQIANEYPEGTVVKLCHSDFMGPWFFRKVNQDTRLICIDELPDQSALKKYLLPVSSGVIVRRKGQRQSIFHPDFVFTSNASPEEFYLNDQFIKDYFEVIILTERKGATQ